jgi:hypothetical protein
MFEDGATREGGEKYFSGIYIPKSFLVEKENIINTVISSIGISMMLKGLRIFGYY